MISVTERNKTKTTNKKATLGYVLELLSAVDSRAKVLEKYVTSGFSRVNDEMNLSHKRTSLTDATLNTMRLKLNDIQDDLTCALGEVDHLSRKSLVQGQRITLLATQQKTEVL